MAKDDGIFKYVALAGLGIVAIYGLNKWLGGREEVVAVRQEGQTDRTEVRQEGRTERTTIRVEGWNDALQDVIDALRGQNGNRSGGTGSNGVIPAKTSHGTPSGPVLAARSYLDAMKANTQNPKAPLTKNLRSPAVYNPRTPSILSPQTILAGGILKTAR
jgi:hypothetical protein